MRRFHAPVTYFQILPVTRFISVQIFLKFLALGCRVFFICALFGLGALLPLNMAGSDGQADLDLYTIANIGNGSPVFWVHWSMIYAFSGVIYWHLYHLFDEYRDLRHHHLVQARAANFSVLVREMCVDSFAILFKVASY